MLKLDSQLCFALYACSKEVIRLYKPYLDPYGLTYTQYITLLVLWEQDNLSVSELGSKLLLDSGTLTPLLKKLEKLELVERVRSAHDERSVLVRLTEKGKQLKENFLGLPQKMFCCTGLNPEEALQLKATLSGLLGKIRTVKNDTD
nr:MarR family transcriptional regulator [uncultured Caproiciproducens sp.]